MLSLAASCQPCRLQALPGRRLAARSPARRVPFACSASPPWAWSPAPIIGPGDDAFGFGGQLAFYGSSSSESESSGADAGDSWLEAAVHALRADPALALSSPGRRAPSRRRLRAAGAALKRALCSAGCHEELAEELVVARPGLLLLDAEVQVAPKLAAVAALAAGIQDDRQDPLVSYHRTSAELLLEAVAWPQALALQNDAFRAGLGLLLQLVAAARDPAAAPGAEDSSAGSTSKDSTSAGSSSSSGSSGGASAAPASSTRVRDVLLEMNASHVAELLTADSAHVASVMDALQAYLGWPRQLAALATLGCPTAPAARALLAGRGSAGSLGERCSHVLAAAGREACSELGRSLALLASLQGCPFEGSLLRAVPAEIADVAIWLGHLGFDRGSSALLTAAAGVDWAARPPKAGAAGLPASGASAALWMLSVPPHSPLAAKVRGMAQAAADSPERQQELAAALVCCAVQRV